MEITLEGYDLGYRIASFFSSVEIAKTAIFSFGAIDFDYVVFANKKVTFYPSNKEYMLSDDQERELDQYHDYDVVQLSPDGRIRRVFDSSSEDNGIVVTNKCNSNCIMCPSSESSRRNCYDTNVDDLLRLVRHFPSDVKHITVTGGEPFLIGASMFTLLDALKNKFRETEFLLLTNGRIFSSALYCKKLKETIPEKTVIGIPIHGSTQNTHDAITRSPGSFLQTIDGIKNLLTLGIHVELRIVVSKLNYQEITDICSLFVRDFPSVLRVEIMGLEMLGNAAVNKDNVWITYQDAFDASMQGIELLIRNGIDVGLYNFPLCTVDKNFWPIYKKSISDYKVRYAPQCEECDYKKGCGGIFAGTYKLAKDNVIPLRMDSNAKLL